MRHADYVRVGVECEIAVRLGADLESAGGPFNRERVAAAVAWEFVLLGSVVETRWVSIGDEVAVAIDGLGEVRATFTR